MEGALVLRAGVRLVPEGIASRLRDLARRAGFEGVPPSLVAAFAVVAGVAVLLGVWKWWPQDAEGTQTLRSGIVSRVASSSGVGSRGEAGGMRAGEGAAPRASGEASPTRVYVHVAGAVRHPGLYDLTAGARVADAVQDAGGFARDAAQDAVNLARAVVDGEQVFVPTKEEASRADSRNVSAARSVAGGAVGESGAAGTATGQLVNINTADTAVLDTLPGVGPSTAAKIVADREANGRFMSTDDLGRVPGIGPKKLEQLKAAICVD